MVAFLIRRLGWAVISFLVVTLYTYVLFFVLPSNNVANRRGFSGVQPGGLRDSVGQEGSAVKAYASFVGHIVRADLGNSRRTREPVVHVIRRAAPATASLVIGSAILWLLMAFPIGIISALRPRSLIDRAGMVFVLIGISAHPLWLSYMIAYVFGYRLGWFPIAGYCDAFGPAGSCGGPAQWAYHLVLPWFTFALGFAAIYARMIRANLSETLDDDYVRTARAKGLRYRRVVGLHVLRNSLIPVITAAGPLLGFIITGAFVIELIFNIPGIGQYYVTAVNARDYSVVMGLTVLLSVIIIFANLIVDILYGILDPRTRDART